VGAANTIGLISAIRHFRRLETMLKERIAIPEAILEAIISSIPETVVTGAKPGDADDRPSAEDAAHIQSILIKILEGLDSGE